MAIQRVGWRPYITTQVAIDADATAFIAAAGITNLIQASAINMLVNDLKAYGLWTKMKALYPMVGGTATSHKFNLKDPRDLDAAYRLVFNGGWTHTSTGALPNGTTGYADTFFIPSTSLTNNSSHLSYYSRTNRGLRNAYTIGSYQGTPTNNNMDLRFYQNFGNKTSSAQYDGWDGLDYAGYTPTTTSCFAIASKTALNLNKIYENGILKGTNTYTSTKSLPNVRVLIGAQSSGTAGVSGYDILESAFATIGDGLSDTEAANFYNSVQKFQTTLGRQIGDPVLTAGQTANLLETYYGAGAAYSTRRIRTTYTGPALRVRRSSDNTELDINFVANGDLDTAALLSFTGTSNGFVAKWYDQSGNSRDLIQATVLKQPQISMNGVVFTENDKPTIVSTGNSLLSMNTWNMPTYGAYSLFLSIRMNVRRADMFLGHIGNAQLSISRNTSGTNRYYGSADITVAALPNGNNYITIANVSNSVSAWENGTQIMNGVASASDSLLTNPTGINIFDRWATINPLTAGTAISELILYGNDQRTNRSSIESSLISYFNNYSIDSDAQAFITAASITDTNQQKSLNTLVKSLKSGGLWTKMKAIYPMVGGSATSHKFNLKDPRDVDAAFRLLFYGGLSHTGSGVYFNGSNSWCDTRLNAASNLSLTSTHLSFYSATSATNTYSGAEIGIDGYSSWTTPPQDPNAQLGLRVRSAQSGSAITTVGNTSVGYTTNDGYGLTIGSRLGSSSTKIYKGYSTSEFALKGSSTTTNTGTMPNYNVALGKLYNYGEWSNQLCSFASIGDGLTDTEAAKLYGIVQIYQINLGRQV